MRKLIVNCLILLSIILPFWGPLLPITHAADSTPSASIKAKLEILKQEIASKAAKLKSEINQKLQNKAYVGTVKTKSDEHSLTGSKTITLAVPSGLKIVTVNQDTIYETKSKRGRYSFKSLAEEDYVAALGDVDENGVLIAKKIILQPDPSKEVKSVFWGQVISLSEKLVIRTPSLQAPLVKTKDLKNVTITPGDQTNFNGVKLNDFIIVTGVVNDAQILKADFIYMLPQGGFLKTKKMATPSATPASSSAKKK